jgi:hypothetical protein
MLTRKSGEAHAQYSSRLICNDHICRAGVHGLQDTTAQLHNVPTGFAVVNGLLMGAPSMTTALSRHKSKSCYTGLLL